LVGKRFLFVIPPFHGHLNPAAAIATKLCDRGHEVRWVTSSKMRAALPPGAVIYDSITERYDWFYDRARAVAGRRPSEQLTAFYEEAVLPLAGHMLEDVTRACSDFRPELLLVDQHCPAGGMAAEALHIPWASSVPSGQLLNPMSRERQPWIDEQVAQMAESCGAGLRQEISESLVLAYTSPLIAGVDVFPPQTRFVGPAMDSGRAADSEILAELRPGRRVLVSLSTIYGDQSQSFLLKLAEVLDRAGVQGLFSSTHPLPNMPPSAIVRPWLPNLALLPHVDAVVSHGGANTALEALSYGKPLILAPLAFDNFDVTQVLIRAGAAVRVRAHKATTTDVTRAVDTVLNGNSHRNAAEALGASLREGGGASAAAEALLELAA
jgi:UDP:flavonoid glycosyltransferase YjiC (YdhE family)